MPKLTFAADSDTITAPILTSPIEVISTPTPAPTPAPSSDPVTSPITSPIIDPTPTPKPNQSDNNSGSQNSGSGRAEAPVCGDSRPISAPKLLIATANGKNQITLVWSKALDPVSYYLVAYGTKPGSLEYGNPNLGNRNTTSYTVKGLENGRTYYFKVRAGNGCMPGEFSNGMSAKVTGDNIGNKPAVGFKAGILGSNKQDLQFKSITSVEPRITVSSTNFLTKIVNFITHLFKR